MFSEVFAVFTSRVTRHVSRCFASDFAEGDEVGEEGDEEQPRLAGEQEQNAPAQDQTNQQINQNRQRKFHRRYCNPFAAARKKRVGDGSLSRPSFLGRARHSCARVLQTANQFRWRKNTATQRIQKALLENTLVES